MTKSEKETRKEIRENLKERGELLKEVGHLLKELKKLDSKLQFNECYTIWTLIDINMDKIRKLENRYYDLEACL